MGVGPSTARGISGPKSPWVTVVTGESLVPQQGTSGWVSTWVRLRASCDVGRLVHQRLERTLQVGVHGEHSRQGWEKCWDSSVQPGLLGSLSERDEHVHQFCAKGLLLSS